MMAAAGSALPSPLPGLAPPSGPVDALPVRGAMLPGDGGPGSGPAGTAPEGRPSFADELTQRRQALAAPPRPAGGREGALACRGAAPGPGAGALPHGALAEAEAPVPDELLDAPWLQGAPDGARLAAGAADAPTAGTRADDARGRTDTGAGAAARAAGRRDSPRALPSERAIDPPAADDAAGPHAAAGRRRGTPATADASAPDAQALAAQTVAPPVTPASATTAAWLSATAAQHGVDATDARPAQAERPAAVPAAVEHVPTAGAEPVGGAGAGAGAGASGGPAASAAQAPDAAAGAAAPQDTPAAADRAEASLPLAAGDGRAAPRSTAGGAAQPTAARGVSASGRTAAAEAAGRLAQAARPAAAEPAFLGLAAGAEAGAHAGARPGAIAAGSARDAEPARGGAAAPALPGFAGLLEAAAQAQAQGGVSGAPAALPGAPATPLDVNVATPVDSPDFPEALGVQVRLLAQDGLQQAELHLNPAEMGPISVRISLDGTQAQVDFGVDHATTRARVEAGMPELAAALREAGLTLAGGGVSQHPRGDRGGGDRSDEAERHGVAGIRGLRGAPGRTGSGGPDGAPRAVHPRLGPGRLDLYA